MTSRRNPAPPPQHSARASAITTLLKEMIAERRKSYSAAVAHIVKNNANRQTVRGRRKLTLSIDELVKHEAAKSSRRQTQRELKVLVPLLRRVVTGTQQKDGFEPETSATVAALNLALSPMVNGSDKQFEFEKPLASLFLTAFPTMLMRLPAAEPKPPAPRRGVGQAKLELYNKITSAGLLTGPEIDALRDIFWE